MRTRQVKSFVIEIRKGRRRKSVGAAYAGLAEQVAKAIRVQTKHLMAHN